jgi:hypothetical protein
MTVVDECVGELLPEIQHWLFSGRAEVLRGQLDVHFRDGKEEREHTMGPPLRGPGHLEADRLVPLRYHSIGKAHQRIGRVRSRPKTDGVGFPGHWP